MIEATTQQDIENLSKHKDQFVFSVKIKQNKFNVIVEKKADSKNPLFWVFVIEKNNKIYKNGIKETKKDIKEDLFKKLKEMGFKDKGSDINLGGSNLILGMNGSEDNIREENSTFNEEDYIYEVHSFWGLKKTRIDLVSLGFIAGVWKNINGRFCFIPDIDINSTIIIKNQEGKKLLKLKGVRYGSTYREKYYGKKYVIYNYKTKKEETIDLRWQSKRMADTFHNARIHALNKLKSRKNKSKSRKGGMVAGAVLGGINGGVSGAVQGAVIGSTLDGVGSVLRDGDLLINLVYKSKEYKVVSTLYKKQLELRVNIIKKYLTQ